jgi:hypothetical protein
VAIVALALATTPIADAATSSKKPKAKPVAPVAHARYADNSNKVNNYKASIHPTPDTLLPLDGSGRFPASVLPASSATGTPGPRGPAGPQGAAGNSGLNSPGVVTVVFQANGTSVDPQTGAAAATCASGSKVLGGGFNDLTRTVPALSSALPAGSVDEIDESDPFVNSDGTSGWRVRIVNVSTSGAAAGHTFFQAYAICGG